MHRKWQIAKPISNEIKNQFAEVNPIVLQLLHNRGLQTQEAIDEFINPDYGADLHDPFLFRDMQKAVDRIFQAIEKKQSITVHGDYDADGVCATAIAVSVIRTLGGEVDVYIPHRQTEGYGINRATVESLKKSGTDLIISVDCGIANKEEVEYAQKQGMDVIITDHHEEPPALPRAYAIINPHVSGETYPFQELAGSGVAFKLMQALVKADGGKRIKRGFEKWVLDIVAIGTIADCVPLIGENRTLTRYGLVVLRKTKRIGIQKLVSEARFTIPMIDTSAVSFSIVPRLNAAGRINHANTAYELLLTEDRERARELTADLDRTNRERQSVTETILRQSRKQVLEQGDKKMISALGEGWQIGVIGLVAGRLSDEFNRPALVMGTRNGEIVGSGRSIGGFDITRALIESRTFLTQFGGHAGACGFSLDKKHYKSFIKSMEAIAEKELTDKQLTKTIPVDISLDLDQASWDVADSLEAFEPFGVGNPIPIFHTPRCTLDELQRVGKDGKHIRLSVRQGETLRKVIAFGQGSAIDERFSAGDAVDIVYELSFNEWNGNRELQLKLVDLRPA